MIKNLCDLIYKIFYLINKEDRFFLFFIVFFIIITSLLEILSLTSFYYFINSLKSEMVAVSKSLYKKNG